MKMRNFIAKAIVSIVNLDRYPDLIAEIFDSHLLHMNSAANSDQNRIHGLFDILNGLVEKQNIFKFIKFETFVEKLKSLIPLEL